MASQPQQGSSNFSQYTNKSSQHGTNKNIHPMGKSKVFRKKTQDASQNNNRHSLSNTRFKDSNSNLTATMNQLSLPENELSSSLECPICKCIMMPPIYLCEFGHSVCNTCCQNFQEIRCPSCKCEITKRRNITLENIALKFSKQCPNMKYGCKFVVIGDNQSKVLNDHILDCKFEVIKCPIGKVNQRCFWSGNTTDIFKHLFESHSENRKLEAGRLVIFDNFSLEKSDENIQVVNLQENLFIYHVKISPELKTAFWAIQYIGNEKAAAGWKYEFHFFMFRNPIKKILFVETCTSNTQNVELLYKSGNCVAIPFNVLGNYIQPNKKFTFKFYVFKISKNNDTTENDDTE